MSTATDLDDTTLTERLKALAELINTLRCEVWGPGAYDHSVGPSSRRTQATRELEALQREESALIRKRAESRGPIEGRRLSTGWIEPPRPEDSQANADAIRGDPMLRHLSETGEDWT